LTHSAENTFSACDWVPEAKTSSNNAPFRVRCPDCGALLADYLKGIYLRRCWRCKGKALIIALPEIQNVSIISCIHDDQANIVDCPHCGAPLGEFLVGVYRGVCHYCKWGGIISREFVSLIQSFRTLQNPTRDTVWRPGKPPTKRP